MPLWSNLVKATRLDRVDFECSNHSRGTISSYGVIGRCAGLKTQCQVIDVKVRVLLGAQKKNGWIPKWQRGRTTNALGR